MLEANKSLWFERVFAVYNRNLLSRKFDSIWVSNLDSIKREKPSIIYANHSSWWDGLLAFEISQTIKADSYFMMEEKQLKKLFLFQKLGAFSVVRENARQAFKSLNYAVEMLKKNPRRTLWIFPQGKILPNDVRPLRFYRGLAKIVEKTENCRIAPLAFRFEFSGEFKPRIFVKVGTIQTFDSKKKVDSTALTQTLETNLTALLDELKNDIASGNTDGYEKII